jgi:hypothetical protein
MRKEREEKKKMKKKDSLYIFSQMAFTDSLIVTSAAAAGASPARP